MIQIPRFEVINIPNKKFLTVGIKDHTVDKTIVLLDEIVDDKTTISIAEDIVSVIENHLQQMEESDDNGSED